MRRLLSPTAITLVVVSCGGEPTGFGGPDGSPNLNSQAATDISATKTATGNLTKVYQWTIEKSAATASLRLFRGDQAAVTFTVKATKTGSSNVPSVSGQVCVTNNGQDPTEGLQIGDTVQYKVGDGQFQNLAGAGVKITPAQQIPGTPAGGTPQAVCFPYQIAFTPVADASYRNVASVTITNHTGHEGTPFGPLVTAAFTVPADTNGNANVSVNVDDSNGRTWQFGQTGSVTYDQTFACDADAGDNMNTATVRETGQTANATVAVACFALAVSKTVATAFTRTYSWTIDKTGAVADLRIPKGFPQSVDYSVGLAATSTDGAVQASGSITVKNPAPMDVSVLGVSDVASPDVALQVTCPVQFPTTLASGAQLDCTYAGTLPDVSPRTNTATATIRNRSYDAAGTGTAAGTTGFDGTAEVTFGEPASLIDECVDVADGTAGPLGSACAADLPKTFTYELTVGPYTTCGAYDVDNTASFVTNDTQATGSDTWTVTVDVPCGPDCTLSQGYWKNHSEYGPAAHPDAAWLLLAQGPETPFFETGMTWVEVFKQNPKGGNAYIILAHQYAAAWLSGMHGADVSSVVPELQRAIELLDQYDGNPDAMSAVAEAVRQEFLDIAERLDDFNNGRVGPPACSEESGS